MLSAAVRLLLTSSVLSSYTRVMFFLSQTFSCALFLFLNFFLADDTVHLKT